MDDVYSVADGDAPGNIRDAVASLAPWFHNLHLPDGTQTAPDHFLGDFPAYKWREISPHLPEDMSGWRVLDIGCNAGYYTFELARRGAMVAGIDSSSHYLAQARWAAAQFGLENRVLFKEMQVYDIARTPETFDLVLFLGVFYHLRYPLLALDIAAQKTKRLMVFQTMTMPGKEVFDGPEDFEIDQREVMLSPGWPKVAFIEKRFAHDPTNWWAPNHAAVEAMLRSSGFRVIGYPGSEVYLCEPDSAGSSSDEVWRYEEFLAATCRSATENPDFSAFFSRR
ncbi:MAG: TIGR04290 family methyltransferase [Desulfobacteraceae bacterium]|nr:MAG: TIGR04290 family methyltransferase [Desulfobacteraceae bacterium]